jgi:tetratricopeptide (TPR) repeat protein
LINAIDFSIFTPAGLTVFAAMGAMLIGESAGRRSIRKDSHGSVWPMIACGIGLVGFLHYLFMPVSVVVHELEHGRGLPLCFAEDLAYGRAMAWDPFDPVPWEVTADRFVTSEDYRDLGKALDYLNGAIGRDPQEQALYRKLGQYYLLRYEEKGDKADLKEAVAAGQRAVELYPSSPDGHVDLGGLLAEAGKELGARKYWVSARKHLEKALALDEARLPGEIRRWPISRREQVKRRLAEVRAMAEEALLTKP